MTDSDNTPASTDDVEETPDGQVATEVAEVPAEEKAEMPIDVDMSSLEALLFSTHHPLTAARLAELLEVKSVKPVHHSVRELNKLYEEQGRAFRVEQVAGGYQMLTLPVFADVIKKHQQKEADAKLGKAAIETLAIIAYKQPILRVNVEAIRGVACGETIRGLMEKHLVKIAGRAEEPGRPILYGTTKRFLEVFGLNSLKDLPEQEDALAVKAKQVREAKAQAKNETLTESETAIAENDAEASLAPSPSTETLPPESTSNAPTDPEAPTPEAPDSSEPSA
ncbi:MAG: scpB [Phycisphaerales bacterium]|nr:scpB [Phycisphaerales bacterium]